VKEGDFIVATVGEDRIALSIKNMKTKKTNLVLTKSGRVIHNLQLCDDLRFSSSLLF
jgi:predicted ribosome-associated RNA-binding protein Tma20